MNNTEDAAYHKRNLPHFYIPNECYFITFCLWAKLPYTKMKRLKEHYDHARDSLDEDENRSDKEYRLWKSYFNAIDTLLQSSDPEHQYLRDDRLAEIVANSMHFYNKSDYNLHCYCVMPNHAHFVFTLNEKAHSISKIMKSIKGFTARECNKILNRKGQFWQDESYDHILRNEREFENIIYYVLNNPVKAGFVEKWRDWQWNYLAEIPIL